MKSSGLIVMFGSSIFIWSSRKIDNFQKMKIEGTNLDVISKVIFVAKYFGAKRTRSIGRPCVHDQHVLLHVALIGRTFSTKVALILEKAIPKLHGSQKDHNFFLVNHGDSIWNINSISNISTNHRLFCGGFLVQNVGIFTQKRQKEGDLPIKNPPPPIIFFSFLDYRKH